MSFNKYTDGKKYNKTRKKYDDTKSLLQEHPELSFVADLEGLALFQKLRVTTLILKGQGLDIDLNDSIFLQTVMKFTNEDNRVVDATKTFDMIQKLAVWRGDETPKKEKIKAVLEEVDGGTVT